MSNYIIFHCQVGYFFMKDNMKTTRNIVDLNSNYGYTYIMSMNKAFSLNFTNVILLN